MFQSYFDFCLYFATDEIFLKSKFRIFFIYLQIYLAIYTPAGIMMLLHKKL